MFLADTREEKLLKVFTIISFVVTYPHEAGLDDVGHNFLLFVRLSTLIVWKKEKCYMLNEVFFIFLMRFVEKFLSLPRNKFKPM